MQISQLLKVLIQKFLCLSQREFPEFSRTHLTLICKFIFNASRSFQTKRTCYLTGLVSILGIRLQVLSEIQPGVQSLPPGVRAGGGQGQRHRVSGHQPRGAGAGAGAQSRPRGHLRSAGVSQIRLLSRYLC